MDTVTLKATTALITPKGRNLSASILKPYTSKVNGETQFYLKLGLDAEAQASPEFRALERAVETVAREYFGAQYAALKKTSQIRLPFRFDSIKPEWASEGITCFLNLKASADQPPAVVDRSRQPIMDEKEVYPGCYLRASVRVFAYGGGNKGYSPGVSFRLQNVQWLDHGPRLSNARGDGSEFGTLDGGLDDLLG